MELSAGERHTARVRHTSHQPTRPNICQQTGNRSNIHRIRSNRHQNENKNKRETITTNKPRDKKENGNFSKPCSFYSDPERLFGILIRPGQNVPDSTRSGPKPLLWIRMFWGLPDPDPLVTRSDPPLGYGSGSFHHQAKNLEKP
jgi:hypothetical protein